MLHSLFMFKMHDISMLHNVKKEIINEKCNIFTCDFNGKSLTLMPKEQKQ